MQRTMSPKAAPQAATALEAAPRHERKAALEAEKTLKDAAANQKQRMKNKHTCISTMFVRELNDAEGRCTRST